MKKLLTHTALLFACVFALQSCGGNTQKATENKNEIKEISISTFGGDMGMSETYIITKDSVHYDFYLAADTTQNVIKSYPNTEQDWGKLLKKVDLEDFKNTENGKSHQAYDGTDTEITIITQNEKITKTNADKTQVGTKFTDNWLKLILDNTKKGQNEKY